MASNSWKNDYWKDVPTSEFVKSYWQDTKRVKVGKTWDRTIRNEVKKSRHLGDKKVVQKPITQGEKIMKAQEKKQALNVIEVLAKGLDLIERFDGICTKSADKLQALNERGLKVRTELLGAEYVKECEAKAEDLIVTVGKKTCEILSPIAKKLVAQAVRGMERKEALEEIRHRKEMDFFAKSSFDGTGFVVKKSEED